MNVERLVVLAGPPCSGKTTIIERLKSGDAAFLSDILKIKGSEKICFMDDWQLHKLNDSKIDQLVLHYDFLRPIRNGFEAFSSDPPLNVIDSASEIVFVTFYAKPSILSARLKKRKFKLLLRFPRPIRLYRTIIRLKNIKLSEKFCLSPELNLHYDKWFEFCRGFDARGHWIVDTSGEEPQMFELSDWISDPGLNACLSAPGSVDFKVDTNR